MKIALFSLALFPLLAQASPAPVEVLGVNEPNMQAVADRAELPARIDTAWKKIEAMLKVPEGPAPIVYLYPFDPSVQPARLTELQEKAREAANPPTTQEEVLKFYARAFGVTYEESFYGPNDADRGRVIQINTALMFVREGMLDRGLGLYVTSHEMMHYALNRIGIDPKFHHCLMVADRGERESLLLEVMGEEIKLGWVNEFLKRPMRGMHGYWEELGHCDAEVSFWKKEAEKSGQAFTFPEEVKKLVDSLPKAR